MSGVVEAAVKCGEAPARSRLEVEVDVDQHPVEAERSDALERLALAENELVAQSHEVAPRARHGRRRR